MEGNGAAVESLLTGNLKVLLLTNVGHEGNDIVAFVNEPSEDARGVWVSAGGLVFVIGFESFNDCRK